MPFDGIVAPEPENRATVSTALTDFANEMGPLPSTVPTIPPAELTTYTEAVTVPAALVDSQMSWVQLPP